MQQIVIYLKSIVPQHVSGVFTLIIRRSDCVTLPMVFCPIEAIVMLESQVARSCHLTLQHHSFIKYTKWPRKLW